MVNLLFVLPKINITGNLTRILKEAEDETD